MKKYIFLLLLIGTLLIGLATNAAAYTLIMTASGLSPFWPSTPIPFWINVSGSPQIANGSDFTAVQNAFQTWGSISNVALSFNYMGTTPVSTVGEDGINLVTFVDSSVPIGSDTVAATFSFFKVDATGSLTIEESDIALSPTASFSTSGDPGKYDLQGVLTHEIGYLIGLDDSGLASAVMAPYNSPGQVGQRTLTSDDIAGATLLYGNSTVFNALGVLTGDVTLGSNGVNGAQVVAVDVNGTPVASTITLDGFYQIYLPAGNYRVYAQPLTGPLYEDLIGGNPSSFYYQLQTNFSTTYYPEASTLSSATAASITAQNYNNSNGPPTYNIALLPQNLSGPDITEPNTFATRIASGSSQAITFGGNMAAGDSFSTSNTGVTLGAPGYGGSIASDAPDSATITVSVAQGTALGPKNISDLRSNTSATLSGGIVVVNPEPSNIQVSPASGSMDGGTNVTISGLNFQTSPQVYFEGVPATNVQWVSATTIQATTPVNTPGSANVMVVNGDGTWGVTVGAFSYAAQPPAITSVTPTSGPVGTVITIQGSQFDSRPANLSVTINGSSASIVTASATTVTAEVPYGASSGPVVISVLGATATGPSFAVTATPSSTNTAASPSFIDASTAGGGGTNLNFNNTQNASTLVGIPFNFALFNKIYLAGTPIAVCINGWISLDSFTQPEYQNTTLPASTVLLSNGNAAPVPSGLIAPLFEALILRTGSTVSYRTFGVAPSRQFIVEWSNIGILNAQGTDSGGTISFEAILYEGSNDIEFQYQNASGAFSDGSTATIGIQDTTRTLAVQSSYDQSVLSSGSFVFYAFSGGNYTGGFNQLPFSYPNLGGFTATTSGSEANVAVGYATIQPVSGGTTPAGVAIFGYTENNILVSETGVPASPLIQHGILYAEVTEPTGTTNSVDTGVAMTNPNSQAATITFNFTTSAGVSFGSGTTVIPPNGNIGVFLDQAPFLLGTSLEGTFSFSSTVPVSVIALRGFVNERNDFLMSTLPVIDTTAAIPTTPVVLPNFADGGGWASQIVLVNPGSSVMAGTVQFMGQGGQPSTLTANGQTASSFTYSIPANSSFKLLTSGTPAATTVGSVIVTPATGSGTPTSQAIFSFKPAGITVSQAGATPISGTAFRLYVEGSGVAGATGSIQTGVAIANPTSSTATVTISLTNLSGSTIASTSLTIPANGQYQAFFSQIFAGTTLPSPLQGVMRISTNGSGLSVVGLRGHTNQRGDFLITTTPPTNEATPASTAQMTFPRIADGGGYTTEFILFSGSAGQSATGTLQFIAPSGTTFNLGFQN